MAWDPLCKPKDRGGIDLRKTAVVNTTFQCKLAWKIITNRESLWVRLMRNKYLKHQDFLHSNSKQGDSSVWKSIVKCKDLIRQGIRWSVGDGRHILFWFDDWVDNRTLLEIMSLDEHMISNPAAKVCDFMHNKQWNVSVLAQTINNPIIVQKIIGIPIPFNEVQDSFCWGLSTSGAFSTKSATWLTQGSHSLEEPPWPLDGYGELIRCQKLRFLSSKCA